MDVLSKDIQENKNFDCFIIDEDGEQCNVISNATEADNNLDVDPENSKDSKAPNGTTEHKEESQEVTTDVCDVPLYDTAFTGFLAAKEYSIETGKHIPNDAKPKKVCFNCLGDHNINECEVKRNFKDIARNRKNILGRRVANVRYHEEALNKYGSFVPGQISDSLRYALGLRDQDAPEFIYRMRVLGYPPGWLKEAEVRRSDVALFDGNGKVLCHPEAEEGEADMSIIKYQPEKLITFPGFNAPLPSSMKDDHRYYQCPRMQPHHRKEEFERLMIMNRVVKYKRKKLKVSDTPQSTPVDAPSSNIVIPSTGAEMEIEDAGLVSNANIEFNPPLPTEKLPPLPTSAPPSDTEELEEGEFSENSSDALRVDKNSCTNSEANDETKLVMITPKNRLSPTITDNQIANGSEDSSGFETPVSSTSARKHKRHHRSNSKGFTLGVSIPESITPFKSLPSAEKWSADVSDHLLFENLPNALGTWGKMKGLVQSVRKFVEALNAEEDGEEC